MRGLEKAIANLTKKIAKIEGATLDGLIDAGMFIKNRAIKQTPIDTGNLRASGYVSWNKKPGGESDGQFKSRNGKPSQMILSKLEAGHAQGMMEDKGELAVLKNPTVRVGYTAFYAGYVHEINAQYIKGNYKFLQNAIDENTKQILNIIKKRVKIK